MKRDMDLIRKILLAIEAHPKHNGWIVFSSIEGYAENDISYHVKLLSEAGLIKARYHHGSKRWAVNRLTWAGHEFLEAARDDSRWEKVKRLVWEKTGSLPFEVLKAALVQAMLHSIS